MRIFQYVVASGLAATCIVGCRANASSESEALGSAESAQSSANSTGWTIEDQRLIAPRWTGDDAKGSMITPMFRGAFPGIEDYVYAPPDGDCNKPQATLRIDWDKAANTVTVVVKGKGFEPHPNVRRTEGVDWWPNQFHDAPKDITNGGYRLWIILGSVARTAHFYYDPNTLQLQGSEFNFAGGAPPGPAIPVDFPIFSITGSGLFHPAEDGTVYYSYTVPYSRVTVTDGKFSQSWASFIPQDLCEAAPFQPGISQLRPYASPWLPPDIAPSWDNMLHRGVGFDIQIDDASPQDPYYGDNLPYTFSGVSYLGNMASLQGGTPKGTHMQLLTALQQVAPVLDLDPTKNGCVGYVSEPHVTAPRYCEGGH